MFIDSVMNKEKLHEQWKTCVIVTIYKTVVIIKVYNCYQLKYKILFNAILVRIKQCVDTIVKSLGGFRCNRSANLIFAFVRYWRKRGVQ
jgi:hypothetical protein